MEQKLEQTQEALEQTQETLEEALEQTLEEKPSVQIVYNEADVLEAAGYESLAYTSSAYVVAVEGRLQKHDDYTIGFVESAMKVTKNYTGPKIEYLVGAGLMKINSGEKALETVDFTVLGTEASVHASKTSVGYEAKVMLAGGRASLFDINIGFGASSGIGIIDDSLSVKLLGCGFQLGRKVSVSAFDTSFGIDFGRLVN